MDIDYEVPRTVTLGELFEQLDWKQYARQQFQKKVSGTYLPSRYVMISCPHIADEGHLTMYPADPSSDPLTQEGQDLLDYGYENEDVSLYQLDAWLNDPEVFWYEVDTLAFDAFHFTFRGGDGKRKHVYFDLSGNVTSGGDGFPKKVLEGAQQLANDVAKAIRRIARRRHERVVQDNMERFVRFMQTTTVSGKSPPSFRERLAKARKKTLL
jgi:hypothetical protein